MDTAGLRDTACKDYNLYYYQVGGKYPKSSITLLKEVKAWMEQYKTSYTGSGYITFRFRIDCKGNRVKRTRVLQTDEQYRTTHFDQDLVAGLYSFLSTLTEWKINVSAKGNALSYNAFITFRIQDGKVVNIIP